MPTIRPVVITGEPVLHRRAAPVTVIDDEIREIVQDMFVTMDAARGVGLAAPQIGVGLRIFTWQLGNKDGIPSRGVVINPYVTAAKPPVGDPDPHDETEGCLLQHEYDHLNGFLYVDRLEGKWARKAKKAVKAQGWGVPGLTWQPGEDQDPFGHDDETAEEELAE